ncbi:MAG: transcriptional repressor NrdR, partial [Clostridia bacterium]|nr:transcriptional repressor NrdR [Clostridia bacterium]
FTTYERIEDTPDMIVKKDGSREMFDRTKVQAGIVRACQKRPVSYEEIEKLVREVESAVQGAGEHEVLSSRIGEMIMEGLKEIDEVAYVRFASVYRQFKDINTFMDELEVLLKEQKKKVGEK